MFLSYNRVYCIWKVILERQTMFVGWMPVKWSLTINSLPTLTRIFLGQNFSSLPWICSMFNWIIVDEKYISLQVETNRSFHQRWKNNDDQWKKHHQWIFIHHRQGDNGNFYTATNSLNFSMKFVVAYRPFLIWLWNVFVIDLLVLFIISFVGQLSNSSNAKENVSVVPTKMVTRSQSMIFSQWGRQLDIIAL